VEIANQGYLGVAADSSSAATIDGASLTWTSRPFGTHSIGSQMSSAIAQR
jgi:hypothetical protein